MSEQNAPQTPTGTKTFVYTGQRWSESKRRITYRYVELVEGWETNKGIELPEYPGYKYASNYFKQLIPTAKTGSIYTLSVIVKPDGDYLVFTSGAYAPVYQGMWENKAQVDQWWMLGKAAYRQKQMHGQAAKDAREALPLKNLDSLRLAYSRATGEQRVLILAAIIQYITNPNKF